MIFQVLRKSFTSVNAFFQLRVGDVASHNHGATETQSSLNREFGERLANLRHGSVQIDSNYIAAENGVGYLRKELGGVVLKLLEEDSVGSDLAKSLTIGGTRNRDGNRTRCAVAGESNNANVVAEVLAAELSSDP